MEQKSLLQMLSSIIQELESNGQWGTAHVYRSAYNAFELFVRRRDIPFAKLTPALLKGFEIHLRERKCSWNTVSTYMKVVRATYNRAVEEGSAAYVPRLFRHVHTGVSSQRKKALDAADMGGLLGTGDERENALPAGLEYTRNMLRLMFLLRGIPFVDLAYLRRSDIQDNILRYRRRKTGRQLTVILTPEARRLIDKVANRNADSPYLFSFLSSPEGTEEAYREYQRALRSFNRRLAALREYLGGATPISTYTIRHTWATMAYYCEIHPGIISEAMGHSSIAVTETYLKPFRDDRIDDANRAVISFVKRKAKRKTPSESGRP